MHHDSGEKTVPSFYWSSSTSTIDPINAWLVFFNDGFVFVDVKNFDNHVRAVRGGS